MRSKPEMVNSHISSTLVDHLANHVHLHLHTAEKKEQVAVSSHQRLHVITRITGTLWPLTKFATVTSAKDRACGLMRTWSCSLLTRT